MTRSFDFASDDVLCSYQDYAAQEKSNGKRSDSTEKDFHDYQTKGVRPFYSEDDVSKEEMLSAVEKCMKKYADNLLRYLEGISGRLSQLEGHCYKIERSVGDFKSDVSIEHGEADGKLKSLEKHIQEVHRSVQILRDKQELAEAQMELSKLQDIAKESTSSSQSKLGEPSLTPSIAEKHQKPNNAPETPNYQLALPLPHQIQAEQHASPASMSVQQDRYNVSHGGTYYPQQFKHPHGLAMHNSQEISSHAPLRQSQSQLQSTSQCPPPQWLQQAPQQGPQPPSYPPFPSNHPTNPTPQLNQNNAAIQAPYSAMPPPGGAPGGARSSDVLLSYNGPGGLVSQPAPQQQRPEAVAVNYSEPGSSVSQQLPQHHIVHQFPAQTNRNSFGYLANVVHSPVMPQPGPQGYNAANPQSFQTAKYPTTDIPGPKTEQVVLHHPGPHLVHIQPYADLIERAINMGYSRDHVLSAILRMAESNQQVNFNALLDMLNSRSSGASPRAWHV